MNKELRLADEIGYYQLVLEYLYGTMSNERQYILWHRIYSVKINAQMMCAEYPEHFKDYTDWDTLYHRIHNCPDYSRPFSFEDDLWFEHTLNSALYYENRLFKALKLYRTIMEQEYGMKYALDD